MSYIPLRSCTRRKNESVFRMRPLHRGVFRKLPKRRTFFSPFLLMGKSPYGCNIFELEVKQLTKDKHVSVLLLTGGKFLFTNFKRH